MMLAAPFLPVSLLGRSDAAGWVVGRRMRRGSCRALGREIRSPAIGGPPVGGLTIRRLTIGRAARRRGHDQRPLARSRSGHHLDRPGALPALASGARLLHERVRYGTVADVQDLVGTVLAQPDRKSTRLN